MQSENISVNLRKTESSVSVGRRRVDAASAARGGSVKSLEPPAHGVPVPGWRCQPASRPLRLARWPGSSGGGGMASPLPRLPRRPSLPSPRPRPPSLHLLPEEVTDGPVIWFHSLDWSNTCPPPPNAQLLEPSSPQALQSTETPSLGWGQESSEEKNQPSSCKTQLGFKHTEKGTSHGGQVVRTPSFHCRGLEFNP